MAELDPGSGIQEPQLSRDDILVLTVEELKYECLRRELDTAGLTRPGLQALLLDHIGPTVISSSAGRTERVSTPVGQLGEVRSPSLRHVPLPDDDTHSIGAMSDVPPPSYVNHTTSSGEVHVNLHPPCTESFQPGLRPYPQQAVPDPAPSASAAGSMELQLQLRRMELEFAREREERRLQFEERQRLREHELKKLALESSRFSAEDSAPPRPSSFRVDAAVKLVPRFTEHDVETFLISFEKVAELNKFPPDMYAAVLQAHLTGKALKVFSTLSVEELRDYPTVKAAILDAYSVVPEVYRKRFRGLTKGHSETYAEFAFRLSTQFNRWVESKGADSDTALLRDLIQREQFNSIVDSDLRHWLIDQKPKTLKDAAKLADQYVAVHKAERPVSNKGHNGKPKHKFDPHFGKSGGFQQKPAVSTSAVQPKAQSKSFESESKPKASGFSGDKANKVFCYYCKKPCHIMSACLKLKAKGNSDQPIFRDWYILYPIMSINLSLRSK